MAQVTEIEVFFEENFAINKFLSKSTQKSDLETIRNQLKEYGTSLHNSMTEIFKTETESIVDLAENLTNLDSKIHNLILPASQLREEILTLYNTIKSNRQSYDKSLEDFENNQRNRHNLNLQQNLLESKNNVKIVLANQTSENNRINLLNFERMTNNYALQLSFANQLKQETGRNQVEPRLLQNINNKLLGALTAKKVDTVVRSLRLIVNLGQERQTERMYRAKMLSPKLSLIFSQKNLERQGDDLNKLYAQALRVLNEDMNFLMQIINDNQDLRSFQFIRNAFWLEVDKQMTDGLGDVTAPGNPDVFQRRFCATWRFLQTALSRCEASTGAANEIDLDAHVAAHVQRFNLPVYFEIRYQQICSSFETAFVRTIKTTNASIYSDKPEQPHKLYITGAYFDCVSLCFNREIFIQHLSGQFIKLSLLLLTRYLSWYPLYLKNFKATESSGHQRALIYILNDLALVKNSFEGTDPKLSVYNICENDLGDILVELTRTNIETIEQTFQTTIKFIVDLKTEEVVTYLQNVNAIPRLYRKTNRSTPTTASGYIIEAIDVLDKFQTNFQKQPENVVDAVICNVARKFVLLAYDVLHSVSKTEESLKRLKRQTGNASADSVQTKDASSDNYKIREQIRLDVGHFVEKFMATCTEATKSELVRLASSAGYVIT